MAKEPTWKETLEIAHKQTKEKLAPMLKAILEVYNEKHSKNKRKNNM